MPKNQRRYLIVIRSKRNKEYVRNRNNTLRNKRHWAMKHIYFAICARDTRHGVERAMATMRQKRWTMALATRLLTFAIALSGFGSIRFGSVLFCSVWLDLAWFNMAWHGLTWDYEMLWCCQNFLHKIDADHYICERAHPMRALNVCSEYPVWENIEHWAHSIIGN